MLKAMWRGVLAILRKIGEIQSLIILTLVYFVVIGPFALAVKLFSDPLRLRGSRSWHWAPQGGQSTHSLDAARQQF